MECSICFCDLTDQHSVKCNHSSSDKDKRDYQDHSFCQNCLTQFISNHFTNNSETSLINGDATVNCLSMGGNCRATIELRALLDLVDSTQKTRLLENYILTSQKPQPISPKIQPEDGPCEGQIRKMILELLNLHCPNCQLPFIDFDGCLAVSCAPGYGCGGHFCGICFEFYGTGQSGKVQAHRQIPHDHNVMYLTPEQLVPHHQLYRAKKIRDYLHESKEHRIQIANANLNHQRCLRQIFQPIQQELKSALGDRFYYLLTTDGILPESIPTGQLVEQGGLAARPQRQPQPQRRLGDVRDGFPVPINRPVRRGTQPYQGDTRLDINTLSLRPTVPISPTVKSKDKVQILDQISRLSLDHHLSKATRDQLELLSVYIIHLQSHVPTTLQRYEKEFTDKVVTWCQNGMGDDLVLLFQQELVTKLSPTSLQRYLGQEANYDATLYTILQTRDPQRVTQILAPLVD